MQARLRTLLLALALVVQTVAGGAPASNSPQQVAGHEHCPQMRNAASTTSGPAHKGQPKTQSCAHCIFCGVDFGSAIDACTPRFGSFRYAEVERAPVPATRIRATVTHFAAARGPPTKIL